jgi:hypothetical protein
MISMNYEVSSSSLDGHVAPRWCFSATAGRVRLGNAEKQEEKEKKRRR